MTRRPRHVLWLSSGKVDQQAGLVRIVLLARP
jgi:hypothetical protein